MSENTGRDAAQDAAVDQARRPPPGGGDVRAGRRHVADERLDLGRRQDLGTTVSGVQSAIALEALVSAAFILIGSKVGDLIGRKRAYVARACSATRSARSR